MARVSGRRILVWASRSTRPAWLRSIAVGLGLAALCLRALVHDGYIVQVDAVFGPRAGPILSGFGAPVSLLQNVAVHVVGGEATGKIAFFAAIFLAAFAPMVVLRRAPWYAQCTAGLLGALNPWIYDRIVEGQWTIVAAAACLFLWLAAWEDLQAHPGFARATLVGVAGATVVILDPHAAGPLGVLLLGGIVAYRVWREREHLLWAIASAAILGAILAYGVVAFFVDGDSGGYVTVRQFTRADFVFFRSTAGEHGLLVNLMGLNGYWGERIGRFPLLTQTAGWWPAATAVLVVAALVGAWLRRERAWLLVCGGLGLFISASTALPRGVDAAVWLASRAPLVGAYREPQKWSALWLLALVVLAASAIDALARRREVLGAAAACLVVLATLFPAGRSQIRALPTVVRPVRYPSYWYATAASIRRTVPPDAAIVVLPWHLYQPLRATEGRLAANPARVFFPGHLIVPHNLEIPGRATEVTSRYDRIGLVRTSGPRSRCALASELRRLNLHWALVLDGAESVRTVASLHRCGFVLEQGRPGFTALLHS